MRYRFIPEYWIEFEAETDDEANRIAAVLDHQLGVICFNGPGNSDLVYSTMELFEVPAERTPPESLDDDVIREVGFDPEIIDPIHKELADKLSNIESARRRR